jgi:hypothetical protein
MNSPPVSKESFGALVSLSVSVIKQLPPLDRRDGITPPSTSTVSLRLGFW